MKAKLIPGLNCSAPADQMMRLVLRTQLRVMCKLRARALDWSDPEGVHDMRVLSRRMRSTISDFQTHLRKPGLPDKKIKLIAGILGAVRDEDVALAALEGLRAKAPEDAARGIEELVEERRVRQAKARAALMEAISSIALNQFRIELQAQIRTLATVAPKASPDTDAPAPALTFAQVGVKAISRRLKDLRSAAVVIYFPFEIKDIHKLRIHAKRLRYAVELFQNCWGKDLGETAREIADLQTSLGELHDCDVWIEYLGKRLKRATGKRQVDPESVKLRAGHVWLLRHFSKKRTEYYRDALAQWQRWESNSFLDELKSTIHSQPAVTVAQSPKPAKSLKPAESPNVAESANVAESERVAENEKAAESEKSAESEKAAPA